MRAQEFIRETHPTSDDPYVQADEPKSGANALVNLDSEDPNQVIKKEKYFIDPAANGYLLYVKQIKNRRDNHFLPRVSIIKSEEDEQGRQRHTYRIERLFDPRDIRANFDDTHVEMMGRRDIKNWDAVKQEIENSFGKFNAWTTYTMALAKLVQSGQFNQLKNPKMREALDLIKDAMEHSKTGTTGWDLGPSNIMMRLTAQGPQVVISDPL